jgi:hypothetical protein
MAFTMTMYRTTHTHDDHPDQVQYMGGSSPITIASIESDRIVMFRDGRSHQDHLLKSAKRCNLDLVCFCVRRDRREDCGTCGGDLLLYESD